VRNFPYSFQGRLRRPARNERRDHGAGGYQIASAVDVCAARCHALGVTDEAKPWDIEWEQLRDQLKPWDVELEQLRDRLEDLDIRISEIEELLANFDLREWMLDARAETQPEEYRAIDEERKTLALELEAAIQDRETVLAQMSAARGMAFESDWFGFAAEHLVPLAKFVATAIASGVAGNLAYDALKKAVRKKTPRLVHARERELLPELVFHAVIEQCRRYDLKVPSPGTHACHALAQVSG
jgi:hypothetical protein